MKLQMVDKIDFVIKESEAVAKYWLLNLNVITNLNLTLQKLI